MPKAQQSHPKQSNGKLTVSPFIYTRAVTSYEFLGREREIRHLFRRIVTGQSIAIIGQPHIGKTSLLKYALDAQTHQALFGNQFEHDLFRYLDAQMLFGVETQAGFWELALAPLVDKLHNGTPSLKKLITIYEFVHQNKFGMNVLEQLFNEMKKAGFRLILFLDEFDVFLSHPKLHSVEFYGGLRSLASRGMGLVLAIASRRNLQQLTEMTQAINPYGSPYFNVFGELRLGAFSNNEMEALLGCAGDCFDLKDCLFISGISGGHPYLAQVAAGKLWEAQEDGHKGFESYVIAGREINNHNLTKLHFDDTWKYWSPPTRKVVTALSISQILHLLGNHEFSVSEIIENITDYAPELEVLRLSGTLTQRETNEWSIAQSAFLWWLADDLRRTVRNETDTSTWFQSQGIDALLTKRERERMSSAIQKVLSLLDKGALTLIENYASSLDRSSIKKSDKISILFLAADPTDASRLRLGEELREIQEKLQLAKQRERFELHQRMSVRPADISQALLDIQPQIVHFSGHGTSTGALCFENQQGEIHPIATGALAALFEQFADQLECVILNACYSEIQAKAIAKHIDYVIGMSQEIGDKAAIAFSIGFYQAVGAGRSIEDAYKLGCVQIQLQGIPEHLTPVLIKKR